MPYEASELNNEIKVGIIENIFNSLSANIQYSLKILSIPTLLSNSLAETLIAKLNDLYSDPHEILKEVLLIPIWHYRTKICWVIDDDVRGYILERMTTDEKMEIMENVLRVLKDSCNNLDNTYQIKLDDYYIQILCLSCKLKKHIFYGINGFRSLFNLAEENDLVEIERVIDFHLEKIFSDCLSSDELQPKELSNICFMRGYYAFKIGEYEKASKYLTKLYEISGGLIESNMDVAVALHSLGIIKTYKRDHLGARDAFERSVGLLLEIDDRIYLAKVLTSYGNLLSLTPRFYNEAKNLYKHALSILEKESTSQHSEIVITLNSLAELYLKVGKYNNALTLYERVLEIRSITFESEHPEVASTLNNLALIYYQTGQYDRAFTFCMRALNIYEKMSMSKSIDFVTTLNNLAMIYSKKEQYNIALTTCQHAFEICKKDLVRENSYIATTLDNLAMVYYEMRKYDKALTFCQRAYHIRLNEFGLEHLDTAKSLNNLALLYDQMGEYDRAFTFCMGALNIYKNVLLQENNDVATTLNNLAIIYCEKEEYDKALPLFERVLEIRSITFGPEHPEVASTVNNLALVYCQQIGEYDTEQSLCKRSKDYKKFIEQERFEEATKLILHQQLNPILSNLCSSAMS